MCSGSTQMVAGAANSLDVETASKRSKICGQTYMHDASFNIPPRILELTQRKLHNQPAHPLNLIKRRIVDFLYKKHARRTPMGRDETGTPLFSLHDNLSPVVSTAQNFDSLLIEPSHPSRLHTDTYYVNENTLLRSHMTAHQFDLLRSGLDAFLMAGDVYRRDDVDAIHYPVFHQLDGVRLFTADKLFCDSIDPTKSLQLLENIPPELEGLQKNNNYPFQVLPSYALPEDRQLRHTHETCKRLEFELKTVLHSLARSLFGPTSQLRWVDAYFPFTHPSWELEVKTRVGYSEEDVEEEWTELLGCGIMRQEILDNAGISDKVGYAFGLGLERLAMQLYRIPDIRLFWTRDSGFLHQFETDDIHANITYKPISVYPQCILDLSFWLPERSSGSTVELASMSVQRDFCDLVRSVAGDLIEQIRLIDSFTDPKTGRQSHCYRLVYRDQARTLNTDEVRVMHEKVAELASERFGVQIR